MVLVEGRGYRDDDTTGFNAFAVVSYDPHGSRYEIRSYAMGQAGTFILTPTADGKAVAEFSANHTWVEMKLFSQMRQVLSAAIPRMHDVVMALCAGATLQEAAVVGNTESASADQVSANRAASAGIRRARSRQSWNRTSADPMSPCQPENGSRPTSCAQSVDASA